MADTRYIRYSSILKSLAVPRLIWDIAGILVNSLMIYGVIKEKEKFLSPAIYTMPISAFFV